VGRGSGRVFGVAVSLALWTALPGDATAADITVDAAGATRPVVVRMAGSFIVGIDKVLALAITPIASVNGSREVGGM
jgi:hypothetical protein